MTFGFDPELFVMSKRARANATSMHIANPKMDVLSGDDVAYGRGAVWGKEDGFAFELNCKAETCRDRLIPYTAGYLKRWYGANPDWKLSAIPTMQLDRQSVVGDVPVGVNEFGCLPDLNAYTMQEKTPFRSDYHDRYRYAGGHIHFGSISGKTNFVKESKALWVILQDINTAIPFVAMLGETNDFGEVARRQYYGQAGSYRAKTYGVEYRVLSSAVMLSPVLLTWAIGQMRYTNTHTYARSIRATADLKTQLKSLHREYDLNKVQEIINNHDVKAANTFIRKHSLDIANTRLLKVMCDADKKGIGLVTNFYKAWALDGTIRNHQYLAEQSVFGATWRRKELFPPIKLYKGDGNEWAY